MNPEQEQLIAKAKDSLKAARVLANEGLYDFAISRAYYTMCWSAIVTYRQNDQIIRIISVRCSKDSEVKLYES